MGPTNPAKTRSKRYAEKYIKKFETVKKNGKQKRFPDFIITGVQKCGTTGLMHYLQGNPYFKAVPGEAHYFDSAINYAKGLVRDSSKKNLKGIYNDLFFEPVRSFVVYGKNARSSSLSQSL